MRTLFALLLTLVCLAGPPATAAPARAQADGSITARWQPDVNWPHAREVTTHGGSALAHRLVHDLAVARRVPPGVVSCMIDTGAASRLTVRFGGSENHVAVRLNGCRTVTPQGEPARYLTPALRRDLARIAPERWERYLTG